MIKINITNFHSLPNYKISNIIKMNNYEFNNFKTNTMQIEY